MKKQNFKTKKIKKQPPKNGGKTELNGLLTAIEKEGTYFL